MKLLLYKVNTNFFENLLNKGIQRVLPIEWEHLNRNHAYLDSGRTFIAGNNF